jgi:hypothetical protein
MTTRIRSFCTLCAAVLVLAVFHGSLAGITAINAHLAVMACNRSPDCASCAHNQF